MKAVPKCIGTTCAIDCQKNEVRDKTLNGELSVEECDEKDACDFLSLLKKEEDINNELSLG